MEYWTKFLDNENDVDIYIFRFLYGIWSCSTPMPILAKLKAYGISGTILNWVMDVYQIDIKE